MTTAEAAGEVVCGDVGELANDDMENAGDGSGPSVLLSESMLVSVEERFEKNAHVYTTLSNSTSAFLPRCPDSNVRV